MSLLETAALGAIAGLTIFLGLPLGRMRTVGERTRVALAMFAVGVLAFIFVDVLANGHDIVVHALDRYKSHHGSLGRVVWLTVLLGGGFLAGSAGLALVERRIRRAGPAGPAIAGGASTVAGTEAQALLDEAELARRRALQRSLTIAVAIGLHNFAEGLAIGVSARAGAVSLATVLIIGFALHNATEGFGIVGPLAGVMPSWRWLAGVGLVAGAPTLLGSLVGYAVTSQPLVLAFYALAGGAIFYVIGEVLMGMRRFGHRELGLYLVAVGFIVGVVTDLVVNYGSS